MKILCSFFLVFASFFCGAVHAQIPYCFTKALQLQDAYHYGREAIYTDQLAYQMYGNTLKTPVDGATFGIGDSSKPMLWKAVAADTSNYFRGRGWNATNYLYLTYNSAKAETVIVNIVGDASVFINGVLHAGDPYGDGWLNIPVTLKKGLNELYVRAFGRTAISLYTPQKPVSLVAKDLTLPSIVLKKQNSLLKGGIVVLNTTKIPLLNTSISTTVAGKTTITQVPTVPAFSSRKIIFNIDQSGFDTVGKYSCQVKLNGFGLLDEAQITLEAVTDKDHYSNTFVSNIDGSLQYYSVAPQHAANTANSALFLSVHGAGVEARGQAAAYDYKDWGTIVAATNRRPRGFNWEDWGRLDALEVLSIAKQKFQPDPEKVYLTGHSMGGHGTWFLGATYPDKWAAIAPSAGYPTLKDYGSADGKVPDSSRSTMEQIILRAGNQSDVIKLAKNYKPLGVYIFHGDTDRTVSVNYARQMRKVLGDFHTDFAYYEYPGGDHWISNESVDWKPLFDFFKSHKRLADTAANEIDFTTSSPGISASYRWATVVQQVHPLQYSHLKFTRNKNRDTVDGTTENVLYLKIDLASFATKKTVRFKFDNSAYISVNTALNTEVYLKKENGNWVMADEPAPSQKNPNRYGTFKEAFNNKMVFVYSTLGTPEENEASYNKVIYDAETWYYRGNGAIDIISDKEFNADKFAGRNIIIYGNASTNAAWATLLANCPIQVQRNSITAGGKTWTGDDLATYFVWPQVDALMSVGVVTGTGVKGMKAANANQYFAGASGFPDFMIFNLSMLKNGVDGIKMAGYYTNDWKLSKDEYIQAD